MLRTITIIIACVPIAAIIVGLVVMLTGGNGPSTRNHDEYNKALFRG